MPYMAPDPAAPMGGVPKHADGELVPDPRTIGGNTTLILGDEKVLLDRTVAAVPRVHDGDETTGW